MTKILENDGNKLINTDPGFIDVDNDDFQLREDSPAYKLGFKRIPIGEIGLYKDQYRTNIKEIE
jgi:hypothetical protein